MRLGKYLKAAFMNHWNLLGVIGGTVFGLISGQPDIVLPLVAAAELTYLGLLGTHPKFQRSVDAQEAKERRQVGTESAEQALERITRALPDASLERYEALRSRALELRAIADDLRAPGTERQPRPFEKLQMDGLDRLLWIYLRLLYSEYSLQRFLSHTSERAIQADIGRIKNRLAQYSEDEASPRRQKARTALEDNLATSQARLENLEKARENHELVELEIERLENKIRSLSELAVNRQEPEFISDQVDAVASSMLETEQTMQELDFATGFGKLDETVPELTHRKTVRTRGGPG